jgi:hypothetical protein
MRKLLLAVAVLGISVLGSMPPEASAAYPTCSNLYCNTYPGSRCTCPGTVTVHSICNGNWQAGCLLP